MSLKRYDIIIRQNSTITLEDAIIFSKNTVNNLSKTTGNMYYADLFDSRTGSLIKVFSDDAVEYFNIANSVIINDEEITGVIPVLSGSTDSVKAYDV